MSVLDLTRPEHRERLAHCCHAVLVGEMYSTHALRTMPSLDRACFEALSSPTESAAIVRALLDGFGFEVSSGDSGHGSGGLWWARSDNSANYLFLLVGWPRNDAYRPIPADRIPALILRLLACTTREEVLAALREVGR